MKRDSMLPRTLTAAALGALVLALTLTGCSSGGLPGGLPGGGSAAGSGGSGSSGGGASGCTASGTTIPAGHYSGTIKATVKTVMRLTVPGAGTLNNAGRGTQAMNGSVKIVSDGTNVTGSVDLSGLGFSTIANGEAGSAGTGAFTGTISGPASNPIVTGTLSGEWDSFGPVTTSSGSASNGTKVGLHVTNASCSAITGDAIAMFAEIAKPVAQYITISGAGIWTAKRQ
jgi:hypothetical protein